MRNMTITTSTTAASTAPGSSRVSDLYASATQTLLAHNPGLKTIDKQLSRDDARLSSLGKMALALDDFRSAANGLGAGGMMLAASSSGNAVSATLSATPSGGGASAGSHTVEVKQLAQAQQLASPALPGGGAPIGSGAATVIKIESGSGSSTTLHIDAGNNTLDGIAKAARDAGLDAQVVHDAKGYSLRLDGKSGAANAMRISVSGDAALQALFSYPGAGHGGMAETKAARDAQLVVDGKPLSSAANTVGTAIPGVTLKLDAIGKSEVTVAGDASAIGANVKRFVDAFNGMQDKLAALKTGDADTEAVLNQVAAQIGQVFNGADQKALADAGITRRNGKLVLDGAKLDAAAAKDPAALAQLFTNGGKGLAEQLAARAGQQIASGGTVAHHAATVQQDANKLNAQKTAITDNVSRQAAALAQQYAAAGAGGSALFGNGQVKPMSLFDYLA
jgi:flagellar hook-associated protein 2